MKTMGNTRLAFLALSLALTAWVASAQEAAPQDAPSPATAPLEATQPPPMVNPPALLQDDSGFDLAEVNAEVKKQSGGSGDNPGQPSSYPSTIADDGYAVLKTIAALAFVLALFLILAGLVRRYGRKSPLLGGASLARVMGRVYLTPRASLHYIKTGGRVLVVGVCPNQVNLVADFDEQAFESPPEEATPHASGGAFARFMSASHGSKAAPPPEEQSETGPFYAMEDDDLDSMREDLARMRQYLREHTGGGHED